MADKRSAAQIQQAAKVSPVIEHALVRRLRRCYWPEDVFGVYTRAAVLATPPEARFRNELWRGHRDPNDQTYDFGRVHFFMRLLKQGRQLDPIVVETTVYPTRGGPPAWGPPHIEDGHHRFAAAVLAKCRRIPMAFGGLLSSRDWLVGATRSPPTEILEVLRG
jgi:hypothetical protein